MEIKKRNRAELKSYFVKNAIPTESNFADLIDAALIQKSDGLTKLPGDPLSVEAVGDDNSRKQALSLYRSFTDNKPSWSLELSPRSDPNDPATARAGLGFTDGNGVGRLFIDASTGNVGVGTLAPSHILHVRTANAVGLLESTTTNAYLRVQTSEGSDYRVELANRKGGRLALWTAAAGDALSILRDGNVGIRIEAPQRALHVAGTGQLSVSLANGVTTDSSAGLYWNTDDSYSIRRSAGAWAAPDYQQLVLNWPTGIVLSPGTGADAGYGKSYVDIRNGKGLRITDGSLVIGAGDPGSAKLKVVNSATDFTQTIFQGAGMGELRTIGWTSGWNINAQTAGKHLYLNRDAAATTNLYLGRNGLELQVLGSNGNVGVGGEPTTKLQVFGDTIINGTLRVAGGLVDTTINGTLKVNGGLDFSPNVPAHVESDGVFYRFAGQAYLTVDDNFYIRDQGGGDAIKFHFDTNAGIIRQDDWTAPALGFNWVNYGGGYNPVGYYKDRQGMVHLRGLIKNGPAGENATLFTLPAGYRPAARQLHATLTNDNVAGRIDITADGRVIPWVSNPGWLSLDGISFRAV
jgi:hypothetical protein